MKISIVSVAIELSNLSFPLGALCVETAIKSDPRLNDVDCNTVLFTIEDSPSESAMKIKDSGVDLIGLSVYLWNRVWLDSFMNELNIIAPNIKIFAGGTEVSANYPSFNLDKFIFMTAGEGEAPTPVALAQYLNNEEIKGLGIMSKDSPSFSYASVLDLSKLESPILTKVCDPFLIEGGSMLWEMTRGCPFHCGFCFESKGLRGVRDYPYDRIKQEIDYIVDKGINDVFVLDPTFNINKERTMKMLNLIRTKASDIHFSFELRAELLDQDLADGFGSIFCSLQIGLQSIHQDVLKSVGRDFIKKLFKEKITLLEERGIVYGLDLIIGLPHDTLAKFKESLDFTIGCKPSNVDIFPLSLLPGTRIADEADSYGMKYDKNSPYVVKETPSFSKEDMVKAMKIKNGCDLFYTKGQASMYTNLVCETLEIRPSQLFEYFNSYLEYLTSKGHDIEEMDIFDLQDNFLKQMMKKFKKEEYNIPLFSYIEMHQGIAYFFEEGMGPLLSLYYQPNELALLDKQKIERFAKKHEPFEEPKDFMIVELDEGIDFIEYK
ncbi:MAG: radical SAM protein [Spirochaetaceae bacterium]|nr:radical SAM protein [Spirochaetaceae bacterium]